MFLMSWFEHKCRFGGLIRALIKKGTKGYILNEKERVSNMLNLILLKDYGFDVIIARTCFMLDF
jgi:hypothetical protein